MSLRGYKREGDREWLLEALREEHAVVVPAKASFKRCLPEIDAPMQYCAVWPKESRFSRVNLTPLALSVVREDRIDIRIDNVGAHAVAANYLNAVIETAC